MTSFVESLLLNIDKLPLIVVYLFFFLSGFLQIAFPPYPGDTVLVFGGCLDGLHLPATGYIALAGYLSATLVTSLLLYELGYRLTNRIFSIPLITQIMPVDQRASVEVRFKRHGVGLLALCKFIPGINTLVILLGGVLRYPRAKGMGAIALSSLVHNLLFFYVGHILGSNLDAINRFLRDYSLIAAGLAIVAGAIALIWYFGKKRKEKKSNEADSDRRGL